MMSLSRGSSSQMTQCVLSWQSSSTLRDYPQASGSPQAKGTCDYRDIPCSNLFFSQLYVPFSFLPFPFLPLYFLPLSPLSFLSRFLLPSPFLPFPYFRWADKAKIKCGEARVALTGDRDGDREA